MITIRMSCYLNGGINPSLSTGFYNNLTFQSCQCLITQQNILGFQYNSNDNSCYIFGNDSLQSNIQIKINSQVCFINQTSASYTETTTVTSTLPPPPITTSTQVLAGTLYAQEIIYLTNNSPLTSLLIVITVPKTLGVNNPTSYTNFWFGTVTSVINDTDVSSMYIFQIINGQTIASGVWTIIAQYDLTGTVRSTSNDTYIIQTGSSYQAITGHF